MQIFFLFFLFFFFFLTSDKQKQMQSVGEKKVLIMCKWPVRTYIKRVILTRKIISSLVR